MTITDPLSRLVSLLGSSLAMYVSDAGIWSYPGDEEIKLALADLVGDQRNIVERAGCILEDRNVDVPRHAYPIRFTATHDLDLRSLLPRISAELRGQVAAIDGIIAAGGPDAAALELAREARVSTLSHADVLDQLLTRSRSTAS